MGDIMPKTYKITAEEVEIIQKERRKNKNKNIEKKLWALELRYEGLKNPQIAEKIGVHEKTVSEWVCSFKKIGISAITENRYKGNRRNLSIEEELEILSEYEDRANKGEIIEVSELKKKYEEKLGRELSQGHIYRILKRLGWRKVMPRSKHPKKASDEVIETSKKLTQN